MFPVPVFDETSNQPPRPLGFKLLMIGIAMLFAAVMALVFARGGSGGSIMMIILGLAIAMIGAGVVSLLAMRTTPQKAKRGLAGLDMYSVIDRLVDDLDNDEAAYLRRRLDEREEKAKDDLTLTVDELLDQRAQERDSR